MLCRGAVAPEDSAVTASEQSMKLTELTLHRFRVAPPPRPPGLELSCNIFLGSLTITMDHDMPRRHVGDVVAFITVSIFVSLILTGIAVVELYLRDDLKTKRYLSSRRAIFAEAMVVLALCSLEFYHTSLAFVLKYTIQADSNLTFDTEDPLHWSMMIMFTSTMANIAICQIFVALQVHLRMLIVLLCIHMLISLITSLQVQDTDILPLVSSKIGCTLLYYAQAAYFAFFASNAKDATLGAYITNVVTPVNTSVMYCAVISLICSIQASHRCSRTRRHILNFLILISVVFIVIVQTPRVGALVYPPPTVFWKYMDLAAYEVLGSLYPIIAIFLLCFPGSDIFFAPDKDDQKILDQTASLPTSERPAVTP
ncbi:hypothetical protein NM688_g3820 [Phlebia brevispora]|uniref:Uncharacterized protein n=1 Tax=Phlebia brevispora TaxID=194682 RepID=A0ACC1T4T7_9APHY|nr:hypothetical protein NM688_g3820 [Phlebia brevispora]